jgi:hypothetical protein
MHKAWDSLQTLCRDFIGEKMKAIQVSLDGQLIGMFASPDGGPFLAMIANIPRTYMRAHIMTETEIESWQWQLPDIQTGECIEFCITEANPESICPPHFVRQHGPEEFANVERWKDNKGRRDNEGT